MLFDKAGGSEGEETKKNFFPRISAFSSYPRSFRLISLIEFNCEGRGEAAGDRARRGKEGEIERHKNTRVSGAR